MIQPRNSGSGALLSRARKLKAVAIIHPMRQCGIGGKKWIRQFSHGFPITGELSQRCARKAGKKHPTMLSRASFLPTTSARSEERETKSGRAHAQSLWGDAMGQVGRGWLPQPPPHDDTGEMGGWLSSIYNVASRFGAQQEAKISACDVLKRPDTPPMKEQNAHPSGNMGPY